MKLQECSSFNFQQKSETIIEGLKEAQTNITKELQALKGMSNTDIPLIYLQLQSMISASMSVQWLLQGLYIACHVKCIFTWMLNFFLITIFILFIAPQPN